MLYVGHALQRPNDHRADKTQGNTIIFQGDLAAGDAGSLSVWTVNLFRGSNPDFLSGFNSIGYYVHGSGCRATGI